MYFVTEFDFFKFLGKLMLVLKPHWHYIFLFCITYLCIIIIGHICTVVSGSTGVPAGYRLHEILLHTIPFPILHSIYRGRFK